MKSNMCFIPFHVAQVKYVILLHRLLQHTAAAHVYFSPRPSWFILGSMSALGHVACICFHFKKQNEIK